MELKFITFFDDPKNPFIISHLFPVVDEEVESGGMGDVIVAFLGRKNLWGSWGGFSCWTFGSDCCCKVFGRMAFRSFCSETPVGWSCERA